VNGAAVGQRGTPNKKRGAISDPRPWSRAELVFLPPLRREFLPRKFRPQNLGQQPGHFSRPPASPAGNALAHQFERRGQAHRTSVDRGRRASGGGRQHGDERVDQGEALSAWGRTLIACGLASRRWLGRTSPPMRCPLQADGQILPGGGHAERALSAARRQEHGAAHARGLRAQQAGKLGNMATSRASPRPNGSV
jgi:hypothetical protein